MQMWKACIKKAKTREIVQAKVVSVGYRVFGECIGI